MVILGDAAKHLSYQPLAAGVWGGAAPQVLTPASFNHISKSCTGIEPSYSNQEQLSRRMGSSLRPRCTCCQFLPGDLFLPTADDDDDNVTATSSCTPASEEQAHDPIRPTTTGVVNLKDTTTNCDDPTIPTDPAGKREEDSLGVLPQLPMQPRPAWEEIRASSRQLVDTHGHPHLERTDDDDENTNLPDTSNDDVDDPVKSIYRTGGCESSSTPGAAPASSCTAVVSLTCAVAPSDWDACLAHAAQCTHRIPALGVHPWYIDEVLDDNHEHLQERWLERLEDLLRDHPNCLVGEIGLCKQARFLRTYCGGKAKALQLQKDVFVQQLRLAAQWQRAVSVHCVNQHRVLLEVLQSLEKEKGEEETHLMPPAIALHSFTGTAHHVQQLLQWESRLQRPVSAKAPLLYFGFSHAVNWVMCSSDKARRHGIDALRSVPLDRVLVESDVSCTADVVGGTSGAVAYVAWALSQPLHAVAETVARNGLRFLQQQQQQQQQQRMHDPQTQQTTAQLRCSIVP